MLQGKRSVFIGNECTSGVPKYNDAVCVMEALVCSTVNCSAISWKAWVLGIPLKLQQYCWKGETVKLFCVIHPVSVSVSEGTDQASVDGQDKPSDSDQPKAAKKNRCFSCRKKVGLTGKVLTHSPVGLVQWLNSSHFLALSLYVLYILEIHLAVSHFVLPSNSSVCVPRLRLPMRQRVLQHAPVLRRSQLHFQLQGRRSGEDQESQPCLRRGEDTEDLKAGLLWIDVHPEACAFRWPINHLFLSPFPLFIWSC